MDQFKARIQDFAFQNIGWIKKVSRDVLAKSQLTVDSFVKGLLGGTIFFDELCLTVTCRAFNVHCVLLLDGSYWTTCPNNQLSDCLLCLAYVGDYGFKEICAETTAVIDKEATQEENESSEYSSDDDDDDDDDDENLVGTGILNENDTEDNADPKEKLDLKDNSDSNDIDKKPLIMFIPPVDVHNTKDDPIVIMDSDEEQINVKPVIKFKPTATVIGDPIVISDSESETETVQCTANNNNDAAAASFDATLTSPKVTKYSRIKRDHNYTCHLCLQQFVMQASFVTHFNSDHPDNQYKCDFCGSYFESANRLFKHERSHLYLKYKCDFLQKTVSISVPACCTQDPAYRFRQTPMLHV